MKRYLPMQSIALVLALFCCSSFTQRGGGGKTGTGATLPPAGTALVLPSGFQSSIVAENIGEARHIAITKAGDIYIKLLEPKNGKGIVFLKNNGHGYDTSSFGDYGGTGILLNNGYLYASSNTTVYRYKLNSRDEVMDPENPEVIVKGLIDRREHNSKSLAIDGQGNLYVNIGAYSNSCQEQDRVAGSMGRKGCPILDSAGGIWKFRANQPDQTYGDGERYATGIRNTVGMDWNNQTNTLFVMQMGRDQLHDLFPKYYDEKTSAMIPSECFYELHQGANAGWPYIYYDQIKRKQMVAPEYGGNGKKPGDQKYLEPIVTFPGHWAPMAVLFYTGDQFPAKYKNGAFISFHGSWNRSPELQAGYNVVFVPFENGKPTEKWEVFANNFAGTTNIVSPRNAKYRPCGLAQGPDGSIYVSDDSNGAIFKISYVKK